MVDHEPISPTDNSNVTPIGTSLQAYHALLELVPNHGQGASDPALPGLEDTRSRPGSDAERTEAYLADAAMAARAAFAGVLRYGNDRFGSDNQEYLRNRRYVLDAMGALWRYQEEQAAREDPADNTTAGEAGAVILEFRRPNS